MYPRMYVLLKSKNLILSGGLAKANSDGPRGTKEAETPRPRTVALFIHIYIYSNLLTLLTLLTCLLTSYINLYLISQ